MKKWLTMLMLIMVVSSNLPIKQVVLIASEVRGPIVVTADDTASTNEEQPLTNSELLALFNVSSDRGSLAVDQASIDYSKPGEYPVTFTASNSTESTSVTSTLTVVDKLPHISLGANNVNHHLGANFNYKKDFAVSATEIVQDDLTRDVTVDDSQVDYSQVGTYPVIFNVADEEGNTVSTSGTIGFSNSVPTVSAKPSAESTEELDLTDDQLITLFDISASDSDGVEKIIVNDSLVNYSKPGNYPVTASAIDIYGAESSIHTLNLTITDALPSISLVTDAITVPAYSSPDYQALFNPTATEITTGDLNAKITMDSSAVDTNRLGEYPVVFTVSDEEGNIANQNGMVSVEYAAPTIKADATHTIEEENKLSDQQLISLYNVTTTHMASAEVTVDQSTVDYSSPGTYEIIFTITDEYDTSVSISAQLEITDIPPVISTTTTSITSHIGQPIDYFQAFDLSATEFTTGDLTNQIVVDDSQVDILSVGTYPVTFTVADDDGSIDSFNGTVEIENDIPQITNKLGASSPEETELSQKQLIKLFTVSATDSDGIKQIIIDDSSVDYHTPGEYQLIISAEDVYGAVSELQTVTLVIEDLLPTLTVENRIAFNHIDSPVDFQSQFKYSASEITDGDLTSEVVIDDSQVNYLEVGPYDVTFTAIDQEGNAVSETRTLVITDDSPDISSRQYAISPEGLVLSAQDLLHLFNVQITDQDHIKNVSVDQSDIDFMTPDLYYVGFMAEDEYGKVSSKYYAKFVITDTKPTIELTNEQATVHIGSEIDYQGLFAPIASEIRIGDLNQLVSIDDSAVLPATPGTYPVIFSVSDDEQNSVETTGYLTITNDNPVITTNQEISINEETTPTTKQYNQLLNLQITDTDAIKEIGIDDSQVDYSTPGEYPITTSAVDQYNAMSSSQAQVKVLDVLPTISNATDNVLTEVNQSVDYISAFGLQASEIQTGDLTSEITIDDSNVDLSTPGNYEVVATVVDDEQNIATTSVTLTVSAPNLSGTLEVVDDEPNQPTTPSITMQLVNTGNKHLPIIILMLFIVIGLKVVTHKYDQ